MGLVEQALARPAGEREAWLRNACVNDTELYTRTLNYVQWEERMGGFLLNPYRLPERRFAAGEVLDGRFRIVRYVNTGGMGVVYEAVDEKLGKRIALKLARPGYGRRLTPEALHASEVSHPNVCRVFEIHTARIEDGEIEFLTMEFVEGVTLTARLKGAPIPEAEARAIALGIAQGVAEAHRHGVVHGDLKSNNVILGRGPDGGVRAVITDFGLARWARRRDLEAAQELASEVAGTPQYMAPEVSAGLRPSPASDVYALGVILKELADGSHSKWDRIIARCLDQDPANRFLDGSGVEEALNPPRPRRLWLAAAVAVLLAATSGTLVYRWAKTPQESIRLGLAPVESAPELTGPARSIETGAAKVFATLKGGARARFSIAPLKRATHIVHATLVSEGSGLLLRAALTDTHTQATNAQMEFRYGLSEIHYAPAALAGMVTAALRLPPVPVPPVNNTAVRDYTAGIADARRDSTALRGVEELERAIAADPDSPLTWAGLAQAEWEEYFVTSDATWLRRCEESLRDSKRRDPDTAPAHLISGSLYTNAGSYERAEAEYLRSIELDSGNADAHRRLGRVYLRVGRFDEARVEFLKAVEAEPRYFTACRDLGSFYRDRGDLRNALAEFERCVALAPEEPDAHWPLALLYKDLSRYGDAERESKAALALSVTTNAKALVTLALALAYQGKDGEAAPYLVRATQLSPEESLIWMNLGNAYARIHSTAKAKAAFRTGLAKAEREAVTDPRDGGAASRVALLCARVGDRGRAQMEIARALQLSPDSDETRETAILTYEVLGERDRAIAQLQNPRDPVFNFANQYPDLADLRTDPRFKELTNSRRSHQEKGNGK